MNVATIDAKKALEDPEILDATRLYLAREERLRALVLQAQELEELGQHGSAAGLEGNAEHARGELDQAARQLDAVAGEQLAAKLRRLKEEDMPKAKTVQEPAKKNGRGYGNFKPCPDCGGVLRGRHREACPGRKALDGRFPGTTETAAEAQSALREAEAGEPEAHGFEELKPSDLSSACDSLKEKLVARAVLDQEIRELASKIARAAGA
jgi:hypothetical protein